GRATRPGYHAGLQSAHHQTPPMTAPATLDDDQVERLSQLLDQRAVPFKGFNLEALDGFLSALVVTPDVVPAGEWQPVVWGGTTPRWDVDDEALSVQALLLGHWNMAAARCASKARNCPTTWRRCCGCRKKSRSSRTTNSMSAAT